MANFGEQRHEIPTGGNTFWHLPQREKKLRPKPFVIEFVGPMGVGKSTVTKLLVEALQIGGVPCQRVESTRPWRTAGAVRKHANLAAWRAANILLRPRPPVHVLWSQMKKIAGGAECVLALRQQEAVHVVDGGLALILTKSLSYRRATVDGLLANAPMPDLVVACITSVDVAALRCENRGSSKRKLEDVKREHRQHSEGLSLLRSAVPIIEFDTTGQVDELAIASLAKSLRGQCHLTGKQDAT